MRTFLSSTVVVLVLFAAAVFGQADRNAANSIAKGYSESSGYEPRVLPDAYSKKKKKKEDKAAKTNAAAASGQTVEIVMPVSVFDQTGKLVPALTASDFSVFVDDQEQRVDAVEVRSEPLNLVLMLDASPSAENKLKDIQQYASEIVGRLTPDDRVMVVSFSLATRVLVDWTSNRAVIEKAIEKYVKRQSEDGTSLFDAMTDVLDKRLAGVTGRKAIVIFSDGMDTTSQKATYESSLTAAERAGVPVYPVYFDTTSDIKNKMRTSPAIFLLGQGLRLPSGRAALSYEAEAELGRFYLDDLVNLSGGRAIVYDNLKTGRSRLIIAIPDELHGQYVMTFKPAKGAAAGQRRKIRVRVNRPNLLVIARGSLVAETQ